MSLDKSPHRQCCAVLKSSASARNVAYGFNHPPFSLKNALNGFERRKTSFVSAKHRRATLSFTRIVAS